MEAVEAFMEAFMEAVKSVHESAEAATINADRSGGPQDLAIVILGMRGGGSRSPRKMVERRVW